MRDCTPQPNPSSRMCERGTKGCDVRHDEVDIQNFENEGGMVYPEPKDQTMLPYVPPWACQRWGGYEHDWLDCMDCLANYEVYLEEHEREHPTPSAEDINESS
jgi:hypothetical protein